MAVAVSTPNRGPRIEAARRAVPDVAAAVAIALALWLVFDRSPLSFDSYFSVIWGDDLAHGRTPSYDAPLAPTPHPLAIAVAVPLSLLGDAADDAFRALVLLSAGFLCVGVYRLGEALFSWAAGLVAAAIVATRVALLEFANLAAVDIPAAALMVWAVALEARRPRRGAPVLALLAVAGLLRPEAWLLSAAYLVWLAPRLEWPERLRLGALAASAPVLWALSDLLARGDALWSREHTRWVAEDQDLPTGAGSLVGDLPNHIGGIVRADVLAAAILGGIAALAWLRPRARLPLAVIAVNLVGVAVLAFSELPVLQRFVVISGCMLAVLAGAGVFGWRSLPPEHPLRKRWRIAGAALLVVMLVGLAFELDRAADLRDRLAGMDRVKDELAALSDDPAARPVLARCRPVYLMATGFASWLVYDSGIPADALVKGDVPELDPGGALVTYDPAQPPPDLLGPPPDPRGAPPAYSQVATRGRWILTAGCPG